MNNIEAFRLAVYLMQTAETADQHASAKDLVIALAAELSDTEFEQAMAEVTP